jgi:hypothetical protein
MLIGKDAGGYSYVVPGGQGLDGALIDRTRMAEKGAKV